MPARGHILLQRLQHALLDIDRVEYHPFGIRRVSLIRRVIQVAIHRQLQLHIEFNVITAGYWKDKHPVPPWSTGAGIPGRYALVLTDFEYTTILTTYLVHPWVLPGSLHTFPHDANHLAC
jgi:hypothetical protein